MLDNLSTLYSQVYTFEYPRNKGIKRSGVYMIKVKVSELLQKHELNATDLMRKADLAYGTALRLSKDDATGISFDVLDRLCELFGVGVSDIIEYVPSRPRSR